MFKLILVIDVCGISSEIARRWMLLDPTDDNSALVQGMAWGRQATSHYLSQLRPCFMPSYGVTMSQWVKWHLDNGMTAAMPVKQGWMISLRWRHNERDCVSNHQPNDCFLNCLFRGRSKKTSKLRVTGLCAGNSPGTGEFPAQMAINAENISIWWRHHVERIGWCSTLPQQNTTMS